MEIPFDYWTWCKVDSHFDYLGIPDPIKMCTVVYVYFYLSNVHLYKLVFLQGLIKVTISG